MCCKRHVANMIIYMPLAELRAQNPQQVLDGLEDAGNICLDDIQTVVDDGAWCEYLFHLFNRCLQSGKKLLISSDCPSAQLLCALPDLQSRLRSSGDFRLRSLDETERAQALQLRALERGIDLTDDVVTYILTRNPRSFSALLQILDTLDKQSLAEKKRITIPFVRSVIDITAR
jgi:DnaA-homolog protein